MRYIIVHKTGYNYSAPASLSQNELLLQPRQTPVQSVVESAISIAPEPQYRHRRTDYFGNTVDVFMIQHPHNKLEVVARSIVDTVIPGIPRADITLPWEQAAARVAGRNHPVCFRQPDDFPRGAAAVLRPAFLPSGSAGAGRGGRPDAQDLQ
jgi:transglutaminase-like putative cysteine protease